MRYVCYCIESSLTCSQALSRVKLDKSIGRQVDMSGDWSYLIEFGFGVILIAIVVGIELFVIMRTLTSVAIVAAIFGTFLSSVNIKQNVMHQI